MNQRESMAVSANNVQLNPITSLRTLRRHKQTIV
jgi:hypothetical protein